MKIISLGSLALITAMLVACGADTNGDDGDAASSEADVVAGDRDQGGRPSAAEPDFTPIPRALNLREGTSTKDGLVDGDCHRAFVQPVEGIPTHLVKQFANGAIIYPNGGSGPVCVDVHLPNKVSFSGAMLDAIARWGLGAFKGVAVRPGEEEGMEVSFANGTMKVFRGTGRPEDGRYKWAAKEPSAHDVLVGAPCIAGSLMSLRLDNVKVTNILGGAVTTRSIDIDGASVFLAYRYAWQNTKDRGVYAMNDSVIGIFTREAKAAGDAGGSMTELILTKASIRHDEYADPTTHTEAISIKNGGGGEPSVTCHRDVPLDGTMRPAFVCDGL